MLAQVWVRWCRKKARCTRCEEDIESGQPEVFVKIHRENTYPVILRKHIQCWVLDSMDYLEKNPYVPMSGTGRKKLDMSPEDKKTRTKILQRYASLMYRLRRMAKENPILAIEHKELTQQYLSILMDKIEQVGGVPKSWLG